ncbi:phosphatase PAP2 family protein [Evansella clarkii]|jgi:undecaprenyl-diphosphatase|uniref:phosphatase PAP2 family protein n=1 Tax=Evansella clarkii TaxID=79879 RepID=UPI000997CF4B|nr:phosphatase PAP2 family protein [Evansella clarkii]
MKNRFLLTALVISLIIFIISSFYSVYRTDTLFDTLIIDWVNQTISPAGIVFMEAITFMGSGEIILVLTFLVAVILFLKKRIYMALLLLFTTFGGMALNLALKLAFQRERPGEMSYIEVFGYSIELASYSFPSGHTMRSVILFAFLIYLGWLFIFSPLMKTFAYTGSIVMIILVGASRIIVGAHFPTDVIAAVSVSFVWVCFSVFIFPKLLSISNYTKRLADK